MGSRFMRCGWGEMFVTTTIVNRSGGSYPEIPIESPCGFSSLYLDISFSVTVDSRPRRTKLPAEVLR